MTNSPIHEFAGHKSEEKRSDGLGGAATVFAAPGEVDPGFETQWFDSHCHFDFAAFDADREALWQSAQQAGCCGLLIPGISRQQGQALAGFCAGKPWFYAQGLHPYFLTQHRQADIDWLDQALTDPGVVAVGEVGLDRILATTDEILEQQWHWFRLQVELAEAHRLPLILHIRGMHDEAASWLRRRRFTHGGMVHAFSGSGQQAAKWIELGFALGIGGALTHPRAHKLRRTVAALPHSSILLETDSPDMTPVFWGAERNDPRTVPLIAAIVARLQGRLLAEVSTESISVISLLFSRLSINCVKRP